MSLGPGRHSQFANGPLGLADVGPFPTGPFITALEQAAETEAQVFGQLQRHHFLIPTSKQTTGKPSKSFYELCLRSLEADGISQHQWSEVAVVSTSGVFSSLKILNGIDPGRR